MHKIITFMFALWVIFHIKCRKSIRRSRNAYCFPIRPNSFFRVRVLIKHSVEQAVQRGDGPLVSPSPLRLQGRLELRSAGGFGNVNCMSSVSLSLSLSLSRTLTYTREDVCLFPVSGVYNTGPDKKSHCQDEAIKPGFYGALIVFLSTIMAITHFPAASPWPCESALIECILLMEN